MADSHTPPASSDNGEASDGTAANTGKATSPYIKFRIEALSHEGEGFASTEARQEADDPSKEPPVLEFVETRFVRSHKPGNDKLPDDIFDKLAYDRGASYIRVVSPALADALRCVVDYYPELDMAQSKFKIYEPFEVFIHYEKELTAWADRLSRESETDPLTCPNQWAAKHIKIAQDFVRERTQQAVEEERERNARGLCTFDMLWVMLRPGIDVYYDKAATGEHEPYVLYGAISRFTTGARTHYDVKTWNLSATSVFVGPTSAGVRIDRFGGTKEITSLLVYPVDCIGFTPGLTTDDVATLKEHFTKRGEKWFKVRREVKAYDFDGHDITFPRSYYDTQVMVDPISYNWIQKSEQVEHSSESLDPAGPQRICSCDKCEERIYKHAAQSRFVGYRDINPITVESLTPHQYFLCDHAVECFLFKQRTWAYLHIDGFKPAKFNKALFNRLVLKRETKLLIEQLTTMYIRDSEKTGQVKKKTPYRKTVDLLKTTPDQHAAQGWSADAIKGKGEGLTFLLHGRPGVGKTYTAECIADHTSRPLLALSCSDIGVDPEKIEVNLHKWFLLAENWGAILLIDEADIYMETRQVQDVERNHLVAGFLHALEYFKGILFLTTNRVGTFDEAFMSRIHIQIHYPDFTDEDRQQLWRTVFQKLEDDRESTMRITQSAQRYVTGEEVRKLKWNGREIRNAFQVAVALAEAGDEKDNDGRVCIRDEHIKAPVKMSQEFGAYLDKLNKGGLSKKIAAAGTRFDGPVHRGSGPGDNI